MPRPRSSTSAARSAAAWRGRPRAASAQAGSIAATVRAKSRQVSTSSAAMTAVGRFLRSPEPGKIAKRAPRAPRYSPPRGSARFCAARSALVRAGAVRSSRMPMCESRPDRIARWISSGSAGRRRARRLAARGADDRAQLPVDVGPFAHAHVVEVLGAAEPPEGARAERGLLLLQVVPEVQQA